MENIQNIIENTYLQDDRLEIIKKVNDKLFNFSQLNFDSEAANNIIFIYTPPKVGSTALVSSIRLCAAHKYSVIHIHDEIMLNYIANIKEDITINELIKYNMTLGKNVYVIDIYRTPIERKISEYFEKLSCYHFNNSEENLINYKLDIIIKRFNCLFPYLGKGDHFYEKYDIGIIKNENFVFDFDKLYIHKIVDNINYIKLRLDDSKEWGKILTKILGTEIIIVSDYQTNDKKIGPLYNKFKENYTLPLNYYDMVKNDKFLNMYLNSQEIEKYLNKWIIKTTENFVPYTEDQYNFYMNLYLENQYINDFQTDHYIDNGCLCKLCSQKRNNIFIKMREGDYGIENKIRDKIIHIEILNENKIKKIEKIKNISKEIVNVMQKNKKKTNKLSDSSFHFTNFTNDKFKQTIGNINFRR